MIETQNIKDRLSWWEYEHFLAALDYTIIGCGIVGLSTAIELKMINPKSKVLILDRKQLPIGASTKNAGFACFGSVSEIWDDYNAYGDKICQKLIHMRWQGLKIMKSRIQKEKMDYKSKLGAEIFKNEEEVTFYENKLSWANSLVSSIVEIDNCFYSHSGQFGHEIINTLEGSINPQKMMMELEQIARDLGVLIMSGIKVEEIDYENKTLNTDLGKVNYHKLIICTNGFSNVLLPNKDIQPARNQVFITNKIPGFDLDNCYHMNKGYVYFREYQGRLLIGGGRNLDMDGESTEELGTTELISDYLNEIIRNHILPSQSYSIEHSWSGILGVGNTKMPIVELIEKDVLVAVRMGGMGVAIGSFIGKVAASMIQSIDNSEHRLYVS